jgi:hypothetical protein
VFKANFRVSFHLANLLGRIIIVVAHFNEMQIKRKFQAIKLIQINVREKRRYNHELTIQRHLVHKTQDED